MSFIQPINGLTLLEQDALMGFVRYYEEEKNQKKEEETKQTIGAMALIELSRQSTDGNSIVPPPKLSSREHNYNSATKKPSTRKRRKKKKKSPNKLFWKKLKEVSPSRSEQLKIQTRLKNPLKYANATRGMNFSTRENRFKRLTVKIIIKEEAFEITPHLTNNYLKGHFKAPTTARKDHANLYAKGLIYGESIEIKAYVKDPTKWPKSHYDKYEVDIKMGNLFFTLKGSMGRTKTPVTQKNIGYLKAKNSKLSIKIEEYIKEQSTKKSGKKRKRNSDKEDGAINKTKTKKRKR